MSLRPLLLLAVACAALLLSSSSVRGQDVLQPRLALVPGGMTVSWTTAQPLNATASVAYGLSASSLTSTALSTSYNLNYVPATTYWHHVVLRGLSPSTTYFWRVLSPSTAAGSVLSFLTAPAVGDRTPYNISINGDMGIAVDNGTVAAMTRALNNIRLFWSPRTRPFPPLAALPLPSAASQLTSGCCVVLLLAVVLVRHIGDLSYADDSSFLYQYFLPGTYLNATYESVTEQWMNSLTPLWSQKPYMVLPGTPHAHTHTHRLRAARHSFLPPAPSPHER